MRNRARFTVFTAVAATLLLPTIASSQQLAPSPATAPVVLSAPMTVTAPATTTDSLVGPIANTRAVGLQRYRLVDSATAPEMMKQKRSQNGNVTLMVVGLATLLVGTVVDDDAGTVLVLTGAGIGLVGLYRYLNQ